MELTRKILIMEAASDISLDYNYHYELMKEIYTSLEISNPALALQIHEEGFRIENKKYKLFTNQFFIENAQYTKNFIKIKKGMKCKLIISGLKEVVKNIVFGFLEKENLNLFNNKFKILNVENDKRIKFNKVTLYKVRNPIVATRQDENKHIIFVNPFEEDFYKILANNLKRKYKLIYNKDYHGELYFDIEDTFSVKKRLISNIKSKFMLIGYSGFELYLVADTDMQKVAYYCGLGSNNVLGMGAVTYVTSRRD